MRAGPGRLGKTLFFTALSMVTSLSLAAQTEAPGPNQQRLVDEIHLLTESLQQTRVELNESRSELRELRTMVQQLREQIQGPTQAPLHSAPAAGQNEKGRSQPGEQPNAAHITEDDWDLLRAKVDEHQQDKVESASKFRVKLSGLLLLNALSSAGRVDNLDLANAAMLPSSGASSGATGASVRQSIIGLSGVGPSILRAHTSGDVQLDFFGGLPAGYASSGSGIARIRLARLRFDWANSSAIGGLDTPFFSPNSPTTYVSVAEPGFSAAGNLWTWSPSLRLEHRLPVRSSEFKLEGGFLDPVGYAYLSQPNRSATPGENSRQPAYAVRLSGSTRNASRPLVIGVAGVYTPQKFPGDARVNGWGGLMDWLVPLPARFEVSGEFFAGKGIDSFGGVAAGPQPQSAGQYSYSIAPTLARLQMIGGWSQLKFRLNARNEFNAAAGYGGRDSQGLRAATGTVTYLASVPARNQLFFGNYIIRPWSNLLFSVEYRKLRTFYVNAKPAEVDQVGLAAGFLF